jgi:hypothetical protein
MRGLTGDELLGLPVRLRGIKLGRTVDVLLHPTAPQAVGLDVLCGDETHRFLPFSAASLADGAVEPGSPLVLLDLEPGSFYRQEARALSQLRGVDVGPGALRDIVLGDDWTIAELIVEDGGGDRRIPLDGLVLPRGTRR